VSATKACPVLLRGDFEAVEILAFEHPLAGFQLVKGTIEASESAAEAAVRELREESGIADASVIADLGLWRSGFRGQVWSFQLCTVEGLLPDEWIHYTQDDGGRSFRFFWHPLGVVPSTQWRPVFRRALARLRGASLAPFLQRALTGAAQFRR